VDQYETRTALPSLRGNITALYITQLEYPLCLECETSIVEQIGQLLELADMGIASFLSQIGKRMFFTMFLKFARLSQVIVASSVA
jgi:hypothetical protein